MNELIPAHLVGRRMETFKDPVKTRDQKGLNVGGYIRISTKKDSQKTSIESQKKLLSEWTGINGFNLFRCYTDVRTGKFVYLRNEIQELLEDLRQGKIKGVVAKEIARTSRDIMDVLELKREIASHGGFFIAIKENYDSRTDDDEFLLILYAALAQKEQKTTASRVKVTQLIKAKEGRTNVAHPAFGYMLSEDRQHLVPNPETAPVYRFIVERYLEGWGQLKIAKWLNEHGVPSKRGARWCTNAIKVILCNPVYLGITIYNTTTLIRDVRGRPKRVMRPKEEWIIRHGTHEPLITEEEFLRVQAIMNKRREKECREWSCARKYLGSGILYCASCGGKVYGTRFECKRNNRVRPPVKKYFYRYICRGLNGQCDSPTKYWPMERVDYNIRELLRQLFADKERLLEQIKINSDLFAQDLTGAFKEREALRQKLARNEHALKKQQIAFEQDVITMDEYRQRTAELRREKQEILDALNRLEARLGEHDAVVDRLESIFNRVAGKLEKIHELPSEEVAEYLDAVFERIYLADDGSIVDVVFRLM